MLHVSCFLCLRFYGHLKSYMSGCDIVLSMGILSRITGMGSAKDGIGQCAKMASQLNSKANVLVEMGRLDDALIMYEEAADMWKKTGDSLLEKGADDRAKQAYERSVRTRSAKGPVYFRLGKYKDALKCVDFLTESYPDAAPNWSNKGMALFYLERYEEALVSFDRALEIDPEFAGALCSKGNCLARLGRYEESLEFFDRARDNAEIEHFDFPTFTWFPLRESSSLKADASQACYFKGLVLSELGRYREAVKAFDEALAVRPELHEIEEAREEAMSHI